MKCSKESIEFSKGAKKERNYGNEFAILQTACT